jgi:PAS domain S-box-containing protein
MDYLEMKKAQLIEEIEALQTKVAELEQGQAERKQAEDALRESEEKYRALAENSPNGIFISDAERFIYVNQRFCEITGFSRDKLLNMPDPVGLIFAPEEHGRVLAYARSRLSGGPTLTHYEARGIRKDREEISLKLAVSSMERG